MSNNLQVDIPTRYLKHNRWDILLRAIQVLEQGYGKSLSSAQSNQLASELINIEGATKKLRQTPEIDFSKITTKLPRFVIEIDQEDNIKCYFFGENRKEEIPASADEPVVVNENKKQNLFSNMIQSINVSKDLVRTPIFELGRRGPYNRYPSIIECDEFVGPKVEYPLPTSHHQVCKNCGYSDSIGGISPIFLKDGWLCYRCEPNYYLDKEGKVQKKLDILLTKGNFGPIGISGPVGVKEDSGEKVVCSCNMRDLMMVGCKCGAIEKERNNA